MTCYCLVTLEVYKRDEEVVASAEVLSQKYPEDLETELSTELGYFAKFAQTSSAWKLQSSHAGKTSGKELHMYEMGCIC